MSEQVIAVLDAFCEKIGVAVDWTQANVLPYVQELISRYITYEIATSVLWCIIAVVGCGIAYAIYRKVNLACHDGDAWLLAVAVLIVMCGAAVCIVCVQAFDIVTCLTFPEKIFIELLKSIS